MNDFIKAKTSNIKMKVQKIKNILEKYSLVTQQVSRLVKARLLNQSSSELRVLC